MGNLSVRDTDDAVSSIIALQEILWVDLHDVENNLRRMERASIAGAAAGADEAVVYRTARTALLSGLASINEVLGWVHLMAEKDPEGNDLDCVRSLPNVNVSLSS
jgi:hypothetical protein